VLPPTARPINPPPKNQGTPPGTGLVAVRWLQDKPQRNYLIALLCCRLFFKKRGFEEPIHRENVPALTFK